MGYGREKGGEGGSAWALSSAGGALRMPVPLPSGRGLNTWRTRPWWHSRDTPGRAAAEAGRRERGAASRGDDGPTALLDHMIKDRRRERGRKADTCVTRRVCGGSDGLQDEQGGCGRIMAAQGGVGGEAASHQEGGPPSAAERAGRQARGEREGVIVQVLSRRGGRGGGGREGGGRLHGAGGRPVPPRREESLARGGGLARPQREESIIVTDL